MRRRAAAAAIAVLAALLAPVSAPPVAMAASNPIVVENQQTGSGSWQFDYDNNGNPLKATNHEIEGYASATSVNKGGSINLMVSLSSAASYTMGIYRMGYYPTGTQADGSACTAANPCGGRLMQSIGPITGSKQANCPTTTTTQNFGLIECNWNVAYSLNIPTTWTTGNYIIKLRRSDTGKESYITFVVRDDGAPADIVLSMDVTTWQAYNFWGGSGNSNVGYNLYGKFNDVTYNNTSSQRAYAVSFNRPYLDQGAQDGAGNFMVWDYPMVRWLEKQGYNVTYATDLDLENNPNLLVGRKAFINTGHDEYYSDNMRANLQGYINGGAHAAFFSANNIYYRIRLGQSSSGQPQRTVICYKDATLDPQSPPTIRWRDLSPPQPENAIVGMLQNGTASDRAFRVYDSSSWIYAGTGLVNYVSGAPVTSGSGQNAIAGVVGYEFDERAANDSTLSAFTSYEPKGLKQVAHSAIPAGDNGVAAYSDATLFASPSGAIVFAAGTLQWSWGVDNGFNDGFCDCNPGYANSKSQQITSNILNQFISTTTSPAAVTLNPTSLAFSSTAVGTTTSAQSVTLANTGGAPLTISGLSITGTNSGEFAQTNNCPLSPTTLAAGASCSISVTFTPTATGTRTAAVSVSDNATGSPHQVSLTGTGASAPAVTTSPTSLSFPSEQIGASSPSQTVTVTNSGSAPLTISGITLTGGNPADFTTTTTCALSPGTLAAGGSCTVGVTFTPTAAGTRTANLTLTDDAANSPQNVPLTGTGTTTPVPAVSLSPTSLAFPSQTVSTTSTAQTVKLTNTGNAALTLNSIGIAGANAGDFAQTNTCPVAPSTVAAGTSCTINVTFSPTAGGTRTAGVTLSDDAADSPQSVTLTGTGAVAGTYLTDGFEAGNLANWTAQASSGGSATVETSVVNSGSDAVALTNASSGQYVGLYADLSGGAHAQTYSRFCFYLSGLSGSAVLAQGRDVNGNNMWEVDYDAGAKGLDAYFWNGARARTDAYVAANLVLAAHWYCAEVQLNESSAGSAQIWLDGTSVGTVSADLSATNAYSRLYVWNNGPAGTVDIDDVQVASAYNGPVGAGAAALPGPRVTLSPTTVTFPSQPMGTPSGSQTVTLTNSGNSPLTISSIGLTGLNASDFAQTNTCPLSPSTLAASGSCAITLTFTPTGTGTRTAALSVADNAPASPQTAALTGTGAPALAPTATFGPTSLTFASQGVNTTSTAQTITLTNTGTAAMSISRISITGTNAGDYAQTNTCPTGTATLAASASCTIAVTFTPTSSGTRVASVTVTDNAAGSPQAVNLSGTGTLPPGVYLTDGFENGMLLWSTVGNGSATVQGTTVNSGARAAALSNSTNGQYTGLSANLAGGGQTQSYTRFCFYLSGLSGTTVLAQGRDAGGSNLWEIDYDAARKGLDIYFWNGARTRFNLFTATNLLVVSKWYCAEIQANETSSGHGEVWLNGTSVASTNANLSVTSAFSRLILWNNGATGTVDMDDVQVASSYNGPVGAGGGSLPAPAVSLSPNSLTFASQNTNTTSPGQNVTLKNSGTAPLSLSGISITGTSAGDFAQANNCPSGTTTLDVGATCTITVTFTPAASGTRTATLSVTDNASGSPHTVALTGTGVVPSAPAVTLAPTSLAFGSLVVGNASSAQSVTLTNSGTAALTISGISLIGPNPGDFVQSSNCPTTPTSLAAGASCTINVAFTPAAAGTRTASVSIADNAPDTPQSVPLTGTGTLSTGTYLSDGFESGLAAWTTIGNGSITTQASFVNSGSSAASLVNGSGQYSGLSADLAGGPEAQTYSRFCFYLSALSGTTVLAQGRDGSGNPMWEVDYDAGSHSLDAYFWNGARARTDIYAATNLVQTTKWYCAEIQMNESSSGHVELWLSGTSVGSASGDFSATNPYSRLYLWNNGSSGSVYFDDVAVTNAYNGPIGAGAVA